MKSILYVSIYTLFVVLLSVGCTIGYYQWVVFSEPENESALVQVDKSVVDNSIIKEGDTFIEVMSYGCHYCSLNEVNVEALEKRLPKNTKIVRIHLAQDGLAGLSSYATLFATLQVMGIEPQYREEIYKAVINEGQNLSESSILRVWLEKHKIDVTQYQVVSQSQAVKDQLAYMAAITDAYHINGTPSFIINKKWIAVQDRDFPAFGEQLLSLSTKDKSLDK